MEQWSVHSENLCHNVTNNSLSCQDYLFILHVLFKCDSEKHTRNKTKQSQLSTWEQRIAVVFT